MITLEQAKSLKLGQTLYATFSFNRKGEPHKVRVNGAVKTWKRAASRVQVPYKHGLRTHGYITERNLGDWALTEEDAKKERGK